MKKLESDETKEKLKIKPLNFEERLKEKLKKLEVIRRPQYREIIPPPIIPIQKIEAKIEIPKKNIKLIENWESYEEVKAANTKKINLNTLKNELTRRFGKGYNSQKIICLFEILKENTETIIEILNLAETPYIKLLEVSYKVKISIKNRIIIIIEKIILYILALEKNRVLLN